MGKNNNSTKASAAANSHSHYAGRRPAGSAHPVTISKNGVRHVRRLPSGEEKEILSVGLACSECFSGPRLASVLRPGFEYEKSILANLQADEYASPISNHTSAGATEALGEFLDALERALPWKNAKELDWLATFQSEGASAVWAAIDMLIQVDVLVTGNKRRKMVAVGDKSYHGPPVTSFGGLSPLWHKTYQVKYPVPKVGEVCDEAKLLKEFEAFLEKHGEEVGVLLIEPQWGSSQASLPWPKTLLQKYVKMTKDRGVRVVCDEIMCGLGRHGHGTVFLSEAWDLDPDAITFGKAIAAGAYPFSGAVMKRGANVLGRNSLSVMQSHTYAGAFVRALMTGVQVLNALPNWLAPVQQLGHEMTNIFARLESISEGMIVTQGQGLLWGGFFTRHGLHENEEERSKTVLSFKKNCEEVGVLPYFVPIGGFMVTPVIDVDVGTMNEMGEKLEEVIKRTMKERAWKPVEGISSVKVIPADIPVVGEKAKEAVIC